MEIILLMVYFSLKKKHCGLLERNLTALTWPSLKMPEKNCEYNWENDVHKSGVSVQSQRFLIINFGIRAIMLKTQQYVTLTYIILY